MSAVIRTQTENKDDILYVVTKGAPEVLEPRLKNKPSDFMRGYKTYASQGGRVIALAYRELNPDDEVDQSVIRGSDRDAAESGLVFGGFAVFQCPLKPESEISLR